MNSMTFCWDNTSCHLKLNQKQTKQYAVVLKNKLQFKKKIVNLNRNKETPVTYLMNSGDTDVPTLKRSSPPPWHGSSSWLTSQSRCTAVAGGNCSTKMESAHCQPSRKMSSKSVNSELRKSLIKGKSPPSTIWLVIIRSIGHPVPAVNDLFTSFRGQVGLWGIRNLVECWGAVKCVVF